MCAAAIQLLLSQSVFADEPAQQPASPLQPEAEFRLRLQFDRFSSEDQERYRMRLRARVGGSYDAGQGLSLGARLSTGSDNPTSSQVTLGDEFSKLAVGIDRAYLRFHRYSWLDLYAGKAVAPFRSRRLVWDRDVQPDGLSQIVEWQEKQQVIGARVATGEYQLLEIADSNDDIYVFVAQAGLFGEAGSLRWSVDGAWYDYVHLAGAVLASSRGSNALDANGGLADDYNIASGLAELELEVSGGQLELFGELADNVAAQSEGLAIAAGSSLSFRAGDVPIELGYEYRHVGHNAIVDALAESSWHRQRTGFAGHRLGVVARLQGGWRLGSSFKFMNTVSGAADRQLEWLVDAGWSL